ncbi:uncharacterized protein LOC109413873 [Aedes albopictus]|uniref:Uncharacterized protein n=1 Tax=Aedes albopictus TaxID=7160 RepID=A0ABM1YME2_AEDAL|nr:uncharacterized protein LOC109413873 [Aedes albopictus]
MKLLESHKLLFVAVIAAFVHVSSAIDCKELWERKHETKECCTADTFINFEALQENIDAQEGNHHEKFFCGVHKLLQDQNLIDGSGNLDTDAMKHNTQGFEESWKQTSQQTIDYCVQRTEETVAEIEQRGGPKGDCKPTAAMFVMCVGKVTMKQCPADKWNSSEICEKVKSGECDKRGPKHH